MKEGNLIKMEPSEKETLNALEKICNDNTILLPWRRPRFKSDEGYCTCSYSLTKGELKDRYAISTCKYKGCRARKVTTLKTADGIETQLYAYECMYKQTKRDKPLSDDEI